MLTAADVFVGGGEMGARMRELDWSATTLGPVEHWPQSLRTAVSIMLASGYPMYIAWGPQYIQFYNDAYRPILGATKHPDALSQSTPVCFAEIWDLIGPMFERVMQHGAATWREDQLLPLDRYGYVEECYFTFSYSAIRDESGGVGGVFVTVVETTGRVLSERRLQTLRDLAARTAQSRTVEDACRTAIESLAENTADLPFALLYLIEPGSGTARLCDMTGLPVDSPACPARIDLLGAAPPWPLAEVLQRGTALLVGDLPARFGGLVSGPWPESPHSALALPIAGPAEQPVGVLVVGISARRPLDTDYRVFLDLLAGQVTSAIANARAYVEERRRAELLAELDRAKTIFFSNVSHEFRTPLALLLGPLEELLADEGLTAQQRAQLTMMERNGLRLLKLVNLLLDFARIEAERIEALYEPVDLAALTTDLVSLFRSAIQRAGLRLLVDLPPLDAPVYVDREMWEKIVSNLLSNAVKWTLRGEISVALRPAQLAGQPAAQLEIRDTGTGIPTAELSQIFERFYRVRNPGARTYEGSGIGLALVRELVQLHGGTITVSSEVGMGTRFCVTLPLGSAHLPAERLGSPRTSSTIGDHPRLYVNEMLGWLPATGGASASGMSVAQSASAAHILLVDDNSDMRTYITALLTPHYRVTAVENGVAALAVLRAQAADLVLSDVMMPELDGFALLDALRADPATREVPLILLSALASEDARLQGIAAGADDYLVKPFSARELLVRVATNLKLAQMRQATAQRERSARREADRAREQLASVFERITDGVIALDRQWRYTYVNRQAARLAQLTPDEMLGKQVWDLFPAAIDRTTSVQLQRALAAQVPVSFERFFAPLNLWIDVRAYPSPDGMTIYLRDLTDQREASAAVDQAAERAARLQAVTAALSGALSFSQVAEVIMQQGVAALDADAGAVAVVTPDGQESELLRVIGYPPELAQLFSRTSLAQAIPLNDAIRNRELVLIGSRDEAAERYPQLTGARSLIDYQAWANVPLLLEDRAVGALDFSFRQPRSFSTDDQLFMLILAQQCAQALERARLYEAEREARAEAEAALKARDIFLSIASHELKTPLTALMGYAQLLQQRLAQLDVGARNLRAVDVLAGQALRLNRLIVTLLDISRIQTGQLQLDVAPLDLNVLIGRVTDEVQLPLAQHTITCELPAEPVMIEADALRLEQVLQNLLQNAIKYSPDGGQVLVQVRCEEGHAHVTIADQGIGIPQAAQARLFERFYRASNIDQQQISGLGIGLYIVHEIVALHGGSVTVESAEGQGSTFTVSLPLLAAVPALELP